MTLADYAGFSYDCMLGMIKAYNRVVQLGLATIEEIGRFDQRAFGVSIRYD